MMYFFLLKKLLQQKNLFGNNKLVDFSKNLSKKNRSKNKFDPPKKITPMPTRMKKKKLKQNNNEKK